MQYLKREIRDRILAAAVEEFKEQGYSDASIRNIANNAEISLGNIYRYYKSKEDLYFAVINPFMENVKMFADNDFTFAGKTMREVAQNIISFLVQYNDELLIICKGNTIHHDAFVSYIIEVIARKIKELCQDVYPEIDSKIQNPNFYNVIAEGFLTSFFKILKNGEDKEVQERKARELISFYFGSMRDRFQNFDVE